jgi:hypothetical protein
MPNRVGPIATIAILAAGGAAVILSGGEEITGGDGGTPVVEEVQLTEADVCPRAIRTPTGRMVRVVGVESKGGNSEVKDTEVGRVVEVVELPSNAICHAIVDARPKAKSQFFPDGNEYVGNVPDIPALKDCYGKASWPVMISGSCLSGPVGSCHWSMLLKGECCKIVGDLPQYEGSTLKEILAKPITIQRRILRTKGRCIGDEGQQIDCTVPIGDPKAIANAPVFISHGWAGRQDLNFVPGKWDSQAEKHVPEDRYTMPEGVGGPP